MMLVLRYWRISIDFSRIFLALTSLNGSPLAGFHLSSNSHFSTTLSRTFCDWIFSNSVWMKYGSNAVGPVCMPSNGAMSEVSFSMEIRDWLM